MHRVHFLTNYIVHFYNFTWFFLICSPASLIFYSFIFFKHFMFYSLYLTLQISEVFGDLNLFVVSYDLWCFLYALLVS